MTRRKQQFEVFIMSCIVFNTIIMAMTFFGMDLDQKSTGKYQLCFRWNSQEAVIKLAGLQ